MEDSTASYENLIQKVLETIGRVPYEKKELTLVRIGHYVRYVTKMREAETIRPLWQT